MLLGFTRGEITKARFDELYKMVDLGGHLQIAGVSADHFSFPIFDARRPTDGDNSEVLLRQYDGTDGFATDSIEVVNGRISGLPVPVSKVRPAGPKGKDSDGSLTLIDNTDSKNRVAYDYWRATTVDENNPRRIAGEIGCSIIEAGAVARWTLNSHALGAMVPEPRRLSRLGIALLRRVVNPRRPRAIESATGNRSY